MAQKQFTQTEVNRIVNARIKRERERMAKDYENSLKRCMAAVHLTLYNANCDIQRQLAMEMSSAKKDMAAETIDPLWSGVNANETQPAGSLQTSQQERYSKIQNRGNENDPGNPSHLSD